MPLSALFLLAMGAGGFLLYSAVKGTHPWQEYQQVISGKPAGPGGPSGPTATPNPQTGVVGQPYVNPNTGTAITPGFPVRGQ